MFFKELKNTIKLLVIIILKCITYKIEKNIEKDSNLDITDYKLIVIIDPKAKIKTISVLFEIVGTDVEICHKMISKRGYTYNEAIKISEDLKKVIPKVKIYVVAMIRPKIY